MISSTPIDTTCCPPRDRRACIYIAAARLRAAARKRNPFACLPQENTFDGLGCGTLATTEQSLDEQADDEDGGRELDGVTQSRFPQSRSWGAGADRAVHQHQMPLLPPHHRGAARGDARGADRAVQPHLAG